MIMSKIPIFFIAEDKFILDGWISYLSSANLLEISLGLTEP